MKKIYVVSQSEKRLLINYKNNHPELDFDILLEEELKSNLLGKVKDSAIVYLKNQGYSFSNAKKIKDLVILLKNEEESIVNFKKYYDEFEKLGYIEKNPYFKEYLKNKEIILYPSCNNSEIKYLLKDYNYLVEEIKTNDVIRDLYEFKTLEESCLGLYALIDEKIKEGVSLEKIKVVSSSPDFIENLKSLNRFYQFPFIFEKEIKKSLFKSYKIFKDTLLEKSLKDTLLELQEDDLIREFISIYIRLKDNCSEKDIIDYIDFYVQGNRVIKEKGSIAFVDKSYIPLKDEILFVPCFVSSIYPNPKNDNTYPGDKEFSKAHLLTSIEKNEIERVRFKEIYYSEGNVIFLKHKYHLKNEYFGSVYEDFYKFNKLNIESKILSKKALLLNLVLNEDNRVLFGKHNPYSNQLKEEVPLYRTYNHQFKTFKDAKKEDKLQLSYSSLSQYLKCPFKYYLSYVLKIDPYEETYETRKGNVFHKYIEDNILGKSYEIEYYLDMFPTKKEKILSKKSFSSAIKAFEIHKDFIANSSFKEEKIEQEFLIELSKDVSLYGRADSLLIDEKNKYISVIDFKSGDVDFDKRYVSVGENLQLPIYLLLVSKKYAEYEPLGAYISQLVSSDYIKKGIISDFKLKGVSSVEEKYRLALDPKASFIAGIKPNKDGSFRSLKRLVDRKEMKELIDQAFNYVLNSGLAIKNGDFKISPRYFDDKSACKYCSYKDICYKEDKDNIIIPKLSLEEEEEE